jgi:hypothetical protein
MRECGNSALQPEASEVAKLEGAEVHTWQLSEMVLSKLVEETTP